jgi:O-succinylhomoserine sulfhydrylase
MNNSNLVLKPKPSTQLERTQYLEHSVPLYLTSSFVFEDAEDMRASFAEEKIETSIAVTTTKYK